MLVKMIIHGLAAAAVIAVAGFAIAQTAPADPQVQTPAPSGVGAQAPVAANGNGYLPADARVSAGNHHRVAEGRPHADSHKDNHGRDHDDDDD